MLLLLLLLPTLYHGQNLATWTFDSVGTGGALTPSGFWRAPEEGSLAATANATLQSGGSWAPTVALSTGLGGSKALSTTQYALSAPNVGPVFMLNLSMFFRPVDFSFFSQRSATGPWCAQLQYSINGPLGPYESFGQNASVPMSWLLASAALPWRALGATSLAVRVRGFNASGGGGHSSD